MNERTRLLRRREAVLTLAGLGLTGALGARGSGVLGTPGAEAAATCVLSPEVTEGPYWIDNHLTRRDITEGRPGLPLELVLTVQDAKSAPRSRAPTVELWHCDAAAASTRATRAVAVGRTRSARRAHRLRSLPARPPEGRRRRPRAAS